MKLVGFLIIVVASILTVFIHEFTKAAVSAKLGDPLPRARNRLTLNPLKHLEPIGLICMVTTMGFGWGKPLETASIYYKDRKKGTIITFITPSIVNILFGISLAFLYSFLNGYFQNIIHLANSEAVALSLGYTLKFIIVLAEINVSLALFNMIPVYPLDGAKILSLFLSPNTQIKVSAYEKIFQIILIIAMMMGIVSFIIKPLVSVLLMPAML